MELEEKTKLSSRTLAKHLNEMTEIQAIERKTDVESGKYPVPVLYRTTPELQEFINANKLRTMVTDGIEPMLDETKDPLFVLDIFHITNQTFFLLLLEKIQKGDITTREKINFLGKYYIWENCREWIPKLIEASCKIINEIDFIQLLKRQAI